MMMTGMMIMIVVSYHLIEGEEAGTARGAEEERDSSGPQLLRLPQVQGGTEGGGAGATD